MAKSHKCLLPLIIIIILSIGFPAQAKTILLPWDIARRFNFNIHQTITASLYIEKGQFQIIYPEGHSQFLSSVETPINKQVQFLANDFNFDGYMDLAIATSYGYGGVNVFYDIYLYDLNQKKLQKALHEPNLEVDMRRNVLASGQKDGPRYYQKEFKFNGLIPYIVWDSVTLALDGLWKVKFYDDDGHFKRVLITDDLVKMEAIHLKLAAPKAYLHSEPGDYTRTKSYIIKGDRVLLLDVAGNWDEWVKVQFNKPGQDPVKGWIKGSDLDLRALSY